jgi:hypothetical protein
MKIVNLVTPLLGRQFDPYLKGVVMPGRLEVNGDTRYMIVGIDPLEVNPRIRADETWDADRITPMRGSNL